MSEPLIDLSGVTKEYPGPATARVLRGIDLTIREGEFVALTGPSGSGKSTLLHILGLLDRASAGAVRVRGLDAGALDDEAVTCLRARTIGFVFQFHHLLPGLSAEENVLLPLAIADGRTSPAARERARELLEAVGLRHRAAVPVGRLSGGEQQRVAIARALVRRPPLVLADEPTGSLDTESADGVFALLRAVHAERGTSFLLVTHDSRLASRCDRRIALVDGRIASDEPVTT